jgi:hypothetical protein
LFIFFAYPKKTNQQRSGERKGSSSLAASLLVCLQQTALCCSKNPGAAKLAAYSVSDSPRAISAFSALLGCVKWQKHTPLLCFVE